MSDAPRPAYAAWARGWGPALALALVLFGARAAYLVWWCPYSLIEDEAQYWEWSRRLDWSYYSKGPGVAWAIGASTRLLGTSEWAVRMPSALSLLVASLAAAGLARDALRDARAPVFAVAAFNLVPVLQASGMLMTIDMPYAACWTLAAWAFWRASAMGSGPCLALAGLAIGAGFLFKYTMLMLVPGLAVFALLPAPPGSRRPGAGWVLVAALLAGAAMAPVFVWNSSHGWPTVKHLLGHLRMEGGDRALPADGPGRSYTPAWTLEYLGAQIGLGGPIFLLAIFESVRAWRARAAEPDVWRAALYLLLCGGPILAIYLVLTAAAPAQQNWPMAGYTTLAVLAAGAVIRGMDDFRARLRAWRALPEPRPRAGTLTRRPETWAQVLWDVALVYGAVAGAGFLRVDLLARVPGLSGVVPVHRLMYADVRAANVLELIERLRAETGAEPFVIAHHYGVAAQSAFYLPGRPVVFCSSAYDGGRRTQYDFFPDTDLDRVTPALRGRPAVLLGGVEGPWAEAFERVETVGLLRGERKTDRPAFLGYGFKGFKGRTAP